jgi:hypothetical protein
MIASFLILLSVFLSFCAGLIVGVRLEHVYHSQIECSRCEKIDPEPEGIALVNSQTGAAIWCPRRRRIPDYSIN